MTSLSIHTPATSVNSIMTMPAISSKKEVNTDSNHITYSMSPKNLWDKPTSKLYFVDWDLNMNELEFE